MSNLDGFTRVRGDVLQDSVADFAADDVRVDGYLVAVKHRFTYENWPMDPDLADPATGDVVDCLSFNAQACLREFVVQVIQRGRYAGKCLQNVLSSRETGVGEDA